MITTGPGAEIVQLVDRSGRAVGAARRDQVRRANLTHAATAVLVRNRLGEIYVTLRSPAKDWCPSHHDAAAGGVLRVAEDPAESARRELAEELGIPGDPARGPALVELGGLYFEDSSNRVFEHIFTVVWDGPIRFADGEVVSGQWFTLTELAQRLRDPDWAFVPDTRALLAELGRRGEEGFEVFG